MLTKPEASKVRNAFENARLRAALLAPEGAYKGLDFSIAPAGSDPGGAHIVNVHTARPLSHGRLAELRREGLVVTELGRALREDELRPVQTTWPCARKKG